MFSKCSGFVEILLFEYSILCGRYVQKNVLLNSTQGSDMCWGLFHLDILDWSVVFRSVLNVSLRLI